MKGRWLASVGLALLLSACGASPEPPASVLLITIDTLRADVVGGRDGRPSLTPSLDALARRGTLFAQTSTVTPLTLPAHASLLTGLRPARHGLTVNGVTSPAWPGAMLARRLGAAGRRTGAFVSTAVLDRRHGLADGFEHYDDELWVEGGPAAPTERRGDVTVDRALSWLEDLDGERFFAWVHVFDPHAPYAAPDGPQGETEEAYRAEVAFVDAQVGRLLEGVRGLETGPVLVAVVADHGEGLGEHGEQTHGVLMFETTMHVPWILSWLRTPPAPTFPLAGQTREDAVSLLDVYPTLLDVVGQEVPADLDGLSVRRMAPDPRSLPLECRAPWFYYGFSPLVGLRRGALKVVGAPAASDPAWTRFDLAVDPGERAGTPATDRLLLEDMPDPEPVSEGQVAADREALVALGYVSADAPQPADRPLRDPRAAMPLIETLDRANTALVGGDVLRAEALLLALPDLDRAVPEVQLMLGRVLRQDRRPDEALGWLASAAGARPQPGVLLELARAWVQLHQDPGARARLVGEAAALEPLHEAAAVLDRVLALVPEDAEAQAQRALVDLLAGRFAAGRERVVAVLVERPRHVGLLTVRLRLAQAEGDAAALESTREVLQAVAPGHPLLRR